MRWKDNKIWLDILKWKESILRNEMFWIILVFIFIFIVSWIITH